MRRPHAGASASIHPPVWLPLSVAVCRGFSTIARAHLAGACAVLPGFRVYGLALTLRAHATCRGAGAGDDLWGSDDDDDRVAAGAGGGREAMSLRDEQSARMKHYKEGYKDAVGQVP